MDLASVGSKTLGLITAGLVVYDAHKNGLIRGTMCAKKNIANTVTDNYVQSLSTSNLSTVEGNAKKSWFRFVLDNNIKEPFDATAGYIKGVLNSVVNDVIPTALAIGTFAFGSTKTTDSAGRTIKKASKIGKICGLGLALYGIKYLLFDVMSIGKRDYLKDDV